MSEHHAALVLGGTGRTGGRVVGGSLSGGEVRATVEAAASLPAGTATRAELTVGEIDVQPRPHEELLEQAWRCGEFASAGARHVPQASPRGAISEAWHAWHAWPSWPPIIAHAVAK